MTLAGIASLAATSSGVHRRSTAPLHLAHRVSNLPRRNRSPKCALTLASCRFGSSSSTRNAPKASLRWSRRLSLVSMTRSSLCASARRAPYGFLVCEDCVGAGTCSASTPRHRSQRASRPRDPSATNRRCLSSVSTVGCDASSSPTISPRAQSTELSARVSRKPCPLDATAAAAALRLVASSTDDSAMGSVVAAVARSRTAGRHLNTRCGAPAPGYTNPPANVRIAVSISVGHSTRCPSGGMLPGG